MNYHYGKIKDCVEKWRNGMMGFIESCCLVTLYNKVQSININA